MVAIRLRYALEQPDESDSTKLLVPTLRLPHGHWLDLSYTREQRADIVPFATELAAVIGVPVTLESPTGDDDITRADQQYADYRRYGPR